MPNINRRHWLLIAIALALILVNVLRWTMASHDSTTSPTLRRATIEADDLRVRAAVSVDNDAPMMRDLFRPKLPPPPKVVKAPPAPPPGPPPKTPEQIEQEAALAELARFRCVATSRRDERWQAFLTQGDQVYLVSVGDRIGSRFVVESIAGDGVYLKDPRTKVSGRVQIAGS